MASRKTLPSLAESMHQRRLGFHQVRIAPSLPTTGLGDRLGLYIMFATIAKLLNVSVFTAWPRGCGDGEGAECKGEGPSRMDQYPSQYNIHQYIRFPPELIFIDHAEFRQLVDHKHTSLRNPLQTLKLVNHKVYKEGFDLMPETTFKMLSRMRSSSLSGARDLASFPFSLAAFRAAHAEASSQTAYIPALPIEPSGPFIGVHARRGDRTAGATSRDLEAASHLLRASVRRLASALPHLPWLILSDSASTREEIKGMLSDKQIVRVPATDHPRLRPLIDFFALSRASIVVASSVGFGTGNGWSSFWYVASRIGHTPLLALVENNTRLHFVAEFAGAQENVTVLTDPIRTRTKMRYEQQPCRQPCGIEPRTLGRQALVCGQAVRWWKMGSICS